VGPLQGVRKEDLDGLTDQRVARVSEELLGLAVYEDDKAVIVDDDHAVGGGLEQRLGGLRAKTRIAPVGRSFITSRRTHPVLSILLHHTCRTEGP
jgi:hypothetical protein